MSSAVVFVLVCCVNAKKTLHKARLTALHAICLQISLQSLFRIFSHASCVHIFRDISGKYSKIHKGFSPFFPSSLKNLTTQSAYVRYETDSHITQKCSRIHQVFTSIFVLSDEKFDDASVAQSLCGILYVLNQIKLVYYVKDK